MQRERSGSPAAKLARAHSARRNRVQQSKLISSPLTASLSSKQTGSCTTCSCEVCNGDASILIFLSYNGQHCGRYGLPRLLHNASQLHSLVSCLSLSRSTCVRYLTFLSCIRRKTQLRRLYKLFTLSIQVMHA